MAVAIDSFGVLFVLRFRVRTLVYGGILTPGATLLGSATPNETLKHPASVTRSQMDSPLEQGVLIKRWLETALVQLA